MLSAGCNMCVATAVSQRGSGVSATARAVASSHAGNTGGSTTFPSCRSWFGGRSDRLHGPGSRFRVHRQAWETRRFLPRMASSSPETMSTLETTRPRDILKNTVVCDGLLVESEQFLDQQQHGDRGRGADDAVDYVCGKLSCSPVEDVVGEGRILVQEEGLSWWDRLMNVMPTRARGLIMLNLLVLLCGTNWVVVKDAGATFDPFSFASLRFLVASALFAPMLVSAVRNTEVVKGGVEIGVYTAIGYLLQAQGLLTTDASRASFLSTFTVLVVPFLAGLSGRGVRPITWASAVAALVGVSMLEQSGSAPSWGDLWSALSAMAFGVQMFRTEHWSRVLGKDAAFQLMSVVLTTTALLSTIAAAAAHPSETAALLKSITVDLSGEHGSTFPLENFASIPWAEVLYTGFLTTDVVLLMEVVALQDVSSVEASIIYTLEPVIGAAFAFVALGERWGPLGWAGAGLIVTSCLVTQMMGSESEDAAPQSAKEKTS